MLYISDLVITTVLNTKNWGSREQNTTCECFSNNNCFEYKNWRS